MKLTKLNAVVIMLFGLGLGACGGSGGATSTPASTPNPTPTPTPKNTLGSVIKTTSTGSMVVSALPNSSDVNKITIDGKNFEIIPKGVTSGSFYQINDAQKELVVGGNGTYSYSRWGYYQDKTSGNSYMFAQVAPTDKVPTTGMARYVGDSVYRDRAGNVVKGTSSFDVDFGNKTLNGKITPLAYRVILLSATINGHTFAGTNATSGYHTEGSFGGSNASELAGTYSNQTLETSGAYGAVKQ